MGSPVKAQWPPTGWEPDRGSGQGGVLANCLPKGTENFLAMISTLGQGQ